MCEFFSCFDKLKESIKSGDAAVGMDFIEYSLLVARLAEEKGDEAKALTMVAIAYSIMGDEKKSRIIYSEAMEILDIIEDPDEKIKVQLGISHVLISAGEREKNEKMLSGALKEAENIEGGLHGAGVLTDIAGRYTEHGDKDAAARILMDALEISETEYDPLDTEVEECWKNQALGSIVGGFSDAEYFDKAFEVIDLIRDEEKKNNNLGYIMRKYIEIGQIAGAVEVADMFDGAYERSNSKVTLAEAFHKAGQTGEAFKNLARAERFAKRVSDGFYRCLAYVSISNAYLEFGEKEKVVECLEYAHEICTMIEDKDFQSGGFYSISEGYVKLEYLDKAAEIADDIYRYDRKAEVLTNIANKYAELGDKKKAFLFFEKAIVLADQALDGGAEMQAEAEALTQSEKEALEDAHAKELAQSLQHIENIKFNKTGWRRQQCLTDIVEAYVGMKEFKKAFDVSEMIDGFPGKGCVSKEMIEEYSASEHTEENAKEITEAFQLAKRFDETEDEFLRSFTRLGVAEEYIEGGDFCKALETTKEITERNWQVSLLIEIASYYVKSSKHLGEKELKLLKEIAGKQA